MKPDFICIGAQKAGTSWLHQQFVSHPEFCMPPVKEFHYFDRSPDYASPNKLSRTSLSSRIRRKGWRKKCLRDICESLRSGNFKLASWWTRFYLLKYTDNWYLSLFESEKALTGDITPSYSILEEKDIKEMQRAVSDTKIIFLIRNPVERAWSWYRFTYENDLQLGNIPVFKSRIDSINQELRSDYLRTIDLFTKYFDSKLFMIGFYDAISSDPEGLLRAIYAHLGVSDIDFSCDLDARINVSIDVECPPGFHSYLVEKYQKSIEELSARYGSYSDLWLQSLSSTRENSEEAKLLAPVACLE